MASTHGAAQQATLMQLEQQRAGVAALVEAVTIPDGVTITEAYAGGVRAYWNDPQGCAMDRVMQGRRRLHHRTGGTPGLRRRLPWP